MCKPADASQLAPMMSTSTVGLGGSSRYSRAEGGPSPNFSPVAHPIAAAEATQEPVESLMQKFKESFRANTPIEICQLQPAPRSASAGRRKRRSRSRGRFSPASSGQDISRLAQVEGARKSCALLPCFSVLVEPRPLSS